MATPQKEAAIAELKERIEGSQIVVLSKYQGINAEQVTELRRRLREQQVEYKVFKNTLAKRVLDELGLDSAAAFMEGPTAWAFCDDSVAPPKVLKDFGREVPVVEMTGGILAGQVVSKDQLENLADLPPKDVLIAQLIGTLAMPLRNAIGVLNAVPRDFVNVVEQIRKQKEEAGGGE